MSWSAHYKSTDENPLETISESGLDSEEAKQQHEVALSAAAALLVSGAVGGPENNFNITLSGHANPGHEKQKGWANDFITINVHQLGEA